MGKGGQIAIAVLSVFAAFVWIAGSQEGTYRFFQSVSELRAEGGSLADSGAELRVRGFVVEGSIRKDLDAVEVAFAIDDLPATPGGIEPAGLTSSPRAEPLEVVYAGIDLPDLFRDGAEVVVEGKLSGGTLRATRVMAKCPSKYENAPGDDGAPTAQGAQLADLTAER